MVMNNVFICLYCFAEVETTNKLYSMCFFHHEAQSETVLAVLVFFVLHSCILSHFETEVNVFVPKGSLFHPL